VTKPAERRELAIMTIVQDEPEFIHPWVNHYRAHVADSRDLFVLVHPRGAVDDAADDADPWHKAERLLSEHHRVSTIRVHRLSSFDHAWLRTTVAKFYAFLLQSYEWVLFAEADEFILPRTEHGRKTLRDVLSAYDPAIPTPIKSIGFEVVQQEGEPALPPDSYSAGTNTSLTAGDLMRDRGHWYPSVMYSKTLLSNVALNWANGFHATENELPSTDPTAPLTLVHLHRADFDLALGRLNRTRARRWAQLDVDNMYGWQNRLANEASLRDYWKHDIDANTPLAPGRLQPIPDLLKKALR